VAAPNSNPILIVGGGIAGLYLRWYLSSRGIDVVLAEHTCLGDGQTIASQGILHRGVKYALSNRAAAASEALAQAQVAWDEHFAGTSSLDLRAVRPHTDTMYLWTRPGLLSSLAGSMTGTAASLAMKSGVRKLAREEYPAQFAGSPKGINLWEVHERCLDIAHLLAALRDSTDTPIIKTHGSIAQLAASINARAVLLTAGVGNEQLIRDLGVDPLPLCQRRPLHMLMMSHAPFPMFAHCLQELSDKPRLTITSSSNEPGCTWYIGGNIAETGLTRGESDQIEAAHAELAACMPWIDPPEGRWSTLRVDRAEAKTSDGHRPDGPVVMPIEGSTLSQPVWALWPTKLALAPALAAAAHQVLQAGGLLADDDVPTAAPQRMAAATDPFPIAQAPWSN
jgi:glycine/D-amino acid oxidase-like deaminating enzyme